MNIKNCETILTIIDKINLNKALAHAFKQAQSPNHRRAQLNIWFDSFLTLKFIHHSRDISAATINFYQLQELVKQQQNIHQSLGQRLAETTVINSL